MPKIVREYHFDFNYQKKKLGYKLRIYRTSFTINGKIQDKSIIYSKNGQIDTSYDYKNDILYLLCDYKNGRLSRICIFRGYENGRLLCVRGFDKKTR
jgi:hypothetical protein